MKTWTDPDSMEPGHHISCCFSETFPAGEAITSRELPEDLVGIIRLEAGSDDGEWI